MKRFQAIGLILNIMQACKRHIVNKEALDEISSGLETCLRKCLMQLAKVSACVCASLPQNATNLLNLQLYTAAVWFIISVTHILKHN